MTIRSIAWAALLGLLLRPGPACRAGVLLANGFDSPGTIYTLDPTTGVASNPRRTGVMNLAGITYRPADGQIYGLTTLGDSTGNSLYRIDPSTGAASLVGATGLSSIFEGDLAIDPTTGILYGLQDVPNASVRHLFAIDFATGAATILGSVDDRGDLSAMAFDGSGNLYVLDTLGDRLLRVSTSDAEILSASPLDGSLGEGAGMAFDSDSGQFYVVGSRTGSLYILDVSTGGLTLVGPAGVPMGTRLAGLAVIPEAAARIASPQTMPEPSTLAQAAICGLAGLLAMARRRSAKAREGRSVRGNYPPRP